MAKARFFPSIAMSPQPAGSLTVKASPGSEVFWEGVSLGRVAADGSLRIAGVPPGIYSVSVQMSGFAPQERRVSMGHDDQTIAFHLKSLTIPPGQTDSPPRQVAPDSPSATAKPTLPVPSTPPSAGDPAQSSLALTTGSLEERSSQIQDTLQTPLFWSIVVICALLAALFRFLWWQRTPPKPPATASGRGSTVPLSSRNESDSNSWPSAPAFLEDLKRREELADRQAAAPRKPSEEPIELGRDDVRAIEE